MRPGAYLAGSSVSWLGGLGVSLASWGVPSTGWAAWGHRRGVTSELTPYEGDSLLHYPEPFWLPGEAHTPQPFYNKAVGRRQ